MAVVRDEGSVLEQLCRLYPVLNVLPAAQRAALAQQVPLCLSAGTLLLCENQPCQGCPLLLAGQIKVVKLASSGREILLYRVEPGGSCIVTSSCLLAQVDYNARGIAETPVTLLMLPAREFSRLLGEQAMFRNFVFHLLSERIVGLMQLVEEVAFARLDQRLARLLLSRQQAVLNLTHQQLADELGSVRENISRLLKGFEAQGLVALGREQLRIVDADGLGKYLMM